MQMELPPLGFPHFHIINADAENLRIYVLLFRHRKFQTLIRHGDQWQFEKIRGTP